MSSKVALSDYSLVGPMAQQAIERGLAEADWYQTPVPRAEMRQLLERRDGPAIRDTLLWFVLLGVSGYAGYALWGTWWAIIPFFFYGFLYASVSDSRWHESSHGTAFKTDWMNNALYELASFMVFRESTPWRWSHTRHHSDTIIVGRDPEIAVPRPPSLKAICLSFIGIRSYYRELRKMLIHATGRMTPEEAAYVPTEYFPIIYVKARIYLGIYLLVAALAVYTRSILPLMYVGLPIFYGSWLLRIYGYTQHAGLAENVLDHRLNCRTVHMNFIHRYLYWNMNYHLEHHMYPLVPYHQLPRLHELVKHDAPPPYRGLLDAYREIIPTVLKQVQDPGYYIRRKLPTTSTPRDAGATVVSSAGSTTQGWIEVCRAEVLPAEDVLRFDHAGRTFAVYRLADGSCHATDGFCTHGRTHLAEGFVTGELIECPKHNGRFSVRDGSPQRAPVCVGLQTYAVKEENGTLLLDLDSAGGVGAAEQQRTQRFRVVGSRNVATFIREVELQPMDADFTWTPGDYLQFDIPVYADLRFSAFDVAEPYRTVWAGHHVFDHVAGNANPTRRNYSIASNPALERTLRLNIRIAMPPIGQDCPAGAGSSWMWQLKPGDEVTAIGPFGDFHIKPTQREMVYLGAGAGMAPLRAHLSQLFDTEQTSRRVSFWYGARTRQELFYEDYFRNLAQRFDNFTFQTALSQPLPEDHWQGPVGRIHDVVREQYLQQHPALQEVEFYLCGPPAMIRATCDMLESLGVNPAQIAYDEFT